MRHADIATVVDGQLFPHSALRVPVGGVHLTRYLASVLEARGMSVPALHSLTRLKELCARTVETAAELDTALVEVCV